MILEVPLAAVPSQTLSVILGAQGCQISVYQKGVTLYCDLALDGSSVFIGKVCRNELDLLSSSKYRGFVGALVFNDTQGDTDPQFWGLGTRYFLSYLTGDDLAAAENLAAA